MPATGTPTATDLGIHPHPDQSLANFRRRINIQESQVITRRLWITWPQVDFPRHPVRSLRMRIDHLVWFCADLDDGKRHFAETMDCPPAYGGAHSGEGTRNSLLS